MAKAKKLPSGQWRTLVYSHTDSNGKRKYESFTADTKKESEYLAAEFALNKKARAKGDITFKEARDNYLKSKTNVLSPSTLRGYKQMNTYFSEIDDLRLSKITQQIIQNWANNFSATHAPKTVSNAHGYINAVIKYYSPDFKLNTTLPQKVKPEYYVPSDEDIKRIIDYFRENDIEMLKAVYLAAFGTMRRSEICGLYADDINKNVVHVHKALVKNLDETLESKTTKTVSSDRYITLPDFVVDVLPKEGKIVCINPDVITKRFIRMFKKLQIKHFRFHDLRHYSASIMHAMGVPDQYIMQRGGWSSDKVLKSIYRGTIEDYEKEFTDMTNNHFNDLCNTKCNTKK